MARELEKNMILKRRGVNWKIWENAADELILLVGGDLLIPKSDHAESRPVCVIRHLLEGRFCCNRLVVRDVGVYLDGTADSSLARESDTLENKMTPAGLGIFPLWSHEWSARLKLE